MKEINMPEPYKTATDQAMKVDKQFFEEHPKRTNYVRAMIPYELPGEGIRFIHVVQIRRSERIRFPMATKDDLRVYAEELNLSVKNAVEYLLREKVFSPTEEQIQRAWAKPLN